MKDEEKRKRKEAGGERKGEELIKKADEGRGKRKRRIGRRGKTLTKERKCKTMM